MKAIVANLLLGSIIYCLSSPTSTLANTSTKKEAQPSHNLSAKISSYDTILFSTPILEDRNLIYSITTDEKNYLKQIIEWDSLSLDNISNITNQFLPEGKQSQIHSGDKGDFILGFHNTFWDSTKNQKYWGLTTIEQWGEGEVQGLKLNKLNYKNSAPILPKGITTLTVSGGGKGSLLKNNDILDEFEDFRGGVAYHEGLADELTFGLGFFYEDFLSGFSQLTYQPTNFPLRTTVSLLTGDKGIDVHSHIQLKPSSDFVLNFYHKPKEQKFDLNLGVVPGLTLTAQGNNQQESLSAGAKFAFKNDLISFLAKAEVTSNSDLEWEISSQMGRLKFNYAIKNFKNNAEINYALGNYSSSVQYGLFFKHNFQQFKRREEQLEIWGLHFHSGEKIANNQYRWDFQLGYGVGSQGKGAIASAQIAINPKLFLKLVYEDISLKSDDTRIKLELKSP